MPECSTNSVVVGDHLKDHTNYNLVTKSYYLVTNTLAQQSKDPCLKPPFCTKYCRQDMPNCPPYLTLTCPYPDDEGGEFQCPRDSSPGVFTKHAHPADCRQYFLCIGGVPREYGCPLGTVFDVGTGTGVDGKCTDPEDVPECSSYYEGQDLGDINRSGADTGPIGPSEDRFRPRPR